MVETASRSVLIVDDNADHAALARLLIEQIHPEIDVVTVADPQLARLRAARLADRSVVLLDRRLGAFDGIDLLRDLRAARPGLVLVLLSASLPADELAEAIAAGADRALEKPTALAGWRELFVDLLGPAPASVDDVA